MNAKARLLAVAVLLGATATSAAADTGTPAAPPPVRTRIQHYGWQVLAADAAAIGIGAAAANLDTAEFLLGSFLVSGPIVHTAHRNYGRALISLGGRVALLALLTAQDPDDEDDASLQIVLGTGVFMLADALLAWDRVPDRSGERSPPALAPVVGADGRGRWWFGLSGRL